MGEKMSFFNSFTDSLKQKWLQFFQVNRDWINVHMEVESVYTPDGGKRPPSYLILGVVNALEPKLAQLMVPFSRLNPDADTLIEVLDLHFDPDMALGNRVLPKVDESNYGESAVDMDENPQDETLTISPTNGYGNEAILKKIQNGFGDQHSNDEFYQNKSVNVVDEFGDISFDGYREVDDTISTATASEETGFADILLDVWGNEVVTHKGEADHKMVSGEDELPSGAFDDSEIARLFPNT
jgi:hypothetical protein